jgi:hypothetical protein
MNPIEDDPLLQKLRALERPKLTGSARASALASAERALVARTSPRRGELVLAAVLMASAMLYAVETMGKLGKIYGESERAPVAARAAVVVLAAR